MFRVEKNKNYTTMANYHLRDPRLSLKAKGLLSLILSLPEDWDYTILGLASLSRDGKDAVRSCLDELGEAGYVRHGRVRREDGTYGGAEYVVYEHPQPAGGVPLSENPTTVEPSPGNPTMADALPGAPSAPKPLSENPSTVGPSSGNPTMAKPTSENPTLDNPTLENPTQQNTEISNTESNNIPPVSPADGGGNQESLSPASPASGRGKQEKFPHGHEAYRCAVYLDGKICERVPGRKPSDEAKLQRWAADFDKCRRIDGYGWKHIMNVLMFSQRDTFWQCNILSAKKFRAKFDMLHMKLMNEGGGLARALPAAQPRVLEREGVREL